LKSELEKKKENEKPHFVCPRIWNVKFMRPRTVVLAMENVCLLVE